MGFWNGHTKYLWHTGIILDFRLCLWMIPGHHTKVYYGKMTKVILTSWDYPVAQRFNTVLCNADSQGSILTECTCFFSRELKFLAPAILWYNLSNNNKTHFTANTRKYVKLGTELMRHTMLRCILSRVCYPPGATPHLIWSIRRFIGLPMHILMHAYIILGCDIIIWPRQYLMSLCVSHTVRLCDAYV